MGGAWVSRQGKLTGGGIVAFFDHGGHGGTRRNAGVWGQSFVNHERHERHEKRDFGGTVISGQWDVFGYGRPRKIAWGLGAGGIFQPRITRMMIAGDSRLSSIF